MSDDDQIMCDECGVRRATWHLTEVVEGRAVQQHLCEQCYLEKEGPPKAEEQFAQLLSAVVPELKEMALRECPSCGLNYLEFRQSMKLGCPHDYEAFEKPLEQLLERIHGATRHTGKVPASAGEEEAVRGRLRGLRKQLQSAVDEEEYERAAELRDRIREIEEHGLDAPEK